MNSVPNCLLMNQNNTIFIPSLYFSKDCTALHRLVHCTATFDEYIIVFVQPVPSTSVHKYNIVFVQREATFMQI